MKCNAKKIDVPGGGFKCSILGDTLGMDIFYDNSPQNIKMKECPDCDAIISYKKGLFGQKYIFKCWVMGEFKVSSNIEELESKLKNR